MKKLTALFLAAGLSLSFATHAIDTDSTVQDVKETSATAKDEGKNIAKEAKATAQETAKDAKKAADKKADKAKNKLNKKLK